MLYKPETAKYTNKSLSLGIDNQTVAYLVKYIKTEILKKYKYENFLKQQLNKQICKLNSPPNKQIILVKWKIEVKHRLTHLKYTVKRHMSLLKLWLYSL